MTKTQLNLLFNYLDGQLYWKIKPSKNIHLGDKAGTLRDDGYVQVSIDSKSYLAHRLIWIHQFGEIPKGQILDHINRNKSDNNILNLRICSISENAWNALKYSNNTSGIKGVCWDSSHEKWKAAANFKNKSFNLGLYDTKELAGLAYMEFVTKYRKEFTPPQLLKEFERTNANT